MAKPGVKRELETPNHSFVLPRQAHGQNGAMLNISAAFHGDEDQLLNGIWISLLSVEALMVVGVAIHGLVGAIAPRFLRSSSTSRFMRHQ
ncbi:hypothetical protein B0H63DRAFT_524389 [Podospora didyma]|uniref:Uncharacterized protein n=1 Tax=Podospora didyma TaxID=330526 RepID=A0AAE0TW37_9PEZI|nr:hypothetical protein B0H63DRAFT_524389 [Podospora didyma]